MTTYTQTIVGPDAQLVKLAIDRFLAKEKEDEAVAARRGIDKTIATLMLDPAKPVGTVSRKIGDVGISVTYGINRKVNSELLKVEFAQLSDAAQGAFRFKAEVDEAAFKALDAETALEVSKYVTSTPASPSVKLS